MSNRDYILMRKDDSLAAVKLNENGLILRFSVRNDMYELLPLEGRQNSQDWLKIWWKERAIPVEQGRIARFLESKGFTIPEEYLMRNLGLSLTDYYWIRPIDLDIKWKDVNLFDNDFTENVLTWSEESDNGESSGTPEYSPNSSLQGQLEKTWTIIDGERYLVKGNHSNLSTESINEIIATEIHRLQGHNNHVQYQLTHIEGKPYDYGCYSKLMTSQKKELVSAYALVTSENKPNDVSVYEHLISVCKMHGMDVDTIKENLDYQILSDYVMSGYDRHLNNIAFIRDADTLKYDGIAPIYDNGGSMFAGQRIPISDKELSSVKTRGFATDEEKMLKLVNNAKALDLAKIPASEFVEEMYSRDSQNNERDIKRLCKIYEKKIDMLEKWQSIH